MTARRSSGFTLIELLLAMAMVAMLMMSLYVGMYTAFKAQKNVTAQTETMRQAKTALDLIEQDLRSILPPSGTFAGPFIASGSGGTDLAATIDCYTLGSDFGRMDATLTEGMRHVQILLVPDATLPVLAREVIRDIMNGDQSTPEEEILARNISGFGVQYYDGASWTDTWDSTTQNNALPLAAEITVEIKAPTALDPQHVYRMIRMVSFPCGQTPDQAAAIAAAAAAADPNATSTGTSTGTSGATPTATGGAQ